MINTIEWVIISYFLIINSVYLLLIISALVFVRKQILLSDIVKPSSLFKSKIYKTISILVPAYNESGILWNLLNHCCGWNIPITRL